MSLWHRIFAAAYDRVMARPEAAGLRDQRVALLRQARGRVLEVGGGTGANVGFYGPEVTELVITEPEPAMLRRLQLSVPGGGVPACVVAAPAEKLPFDDASFDTAVSTLVLCTVGDLPRSLAEIRRVLVPGGRLFFLEHVRAEDPRIARWQDRLHGIWYVFGAGCHCNRATLDAIEGAGFQVTELERGEMPMAPAIVRPLIAGVAVKPR